MEIGDKIMISDTNPNHLGTGVSAYAGFEGELVEIYSDGGFCIRSDSAICVVPIRSAFGARNTIDLYVNNKFTVYKFNEHAESKPKKRSLFELFKLW